MNRALIILLMLVSLFISLKAQEVNLTGKVRDENLTPIAGAVVSVKELGLSDTTDSTGTFIINDPVVDLLSKQSIQSKLKINFRNGLIILTLPKDNMPIEINVYNILGRLITIIKKTDLPAGNHNLPILAPHQRLLSNEMYLLTIKIGNCKETTRFFSSQNNNMTHVYHLDDFSTADILVKSKANIVDTVIIRAACKSLLKLPISNYKYSFKDSLIVLRQSGKWKINQQDSVLQLFFGCGNNFPQYAALHLKSSYLRLNYGSESNWGTSVVITPSFWETKVLQPQWSKNISISNASEVVATNQGLFLRVLTDTLFRSLDTGKTWVPIAFSDSNHSINDIDCDRDTVYLAMDTGATVSIDNGNLFLPSYRWTWDGTTNIDIENGSGWSLIRSWGSLSGPYRKTAGGGWSSTPDTGLSWADVGSLRGVLCIPYQSPQFAYIGTKAGQCYFTSDSGKHWQTVHYKPIFTTMVHDTAYIFTSDSFSTDLGITWRPLGVWITAISTSNILGLFIASDTKGTIYIGKPGEWHYYGSVGQTVSCIQSFCNYCFIVSNDGKLFSSTLPTNQPLNVLNQGSTIAPILIDTSTADLTLVTSSKISSLSILDTITLYPPNRDTVIADVKYSVTGNANLCKRLYETYKPVFLSSMNISGDSADAKFIYIDTAKNSFPFSGWIFQQPVSCKSFGLQGANTTWQASNGNHPAPTILISNINGQIYNCVNITGWKTSTTNPNDDNIGLWAFFDTIVTKFSYRITVTK